MTLNTAYLPLFSGDRAAITRALRDHRGRYYTYVLRRPDGCPFYVGKGQANRALAHEAQAAGSRQSHKLSVIRRILSDGLSLIYEIDRLHETEAEAHSRERELIAFWRRTHEGGCLTNQTSGGDGGYDPSPEAQEKHRLTLGGVADDGSERSTVNRFFLSIGIHRSVAVKPASELRIERTKRLERTTRKPTTRQAVALAASAISNGIAIEPGCRLPRIMRIDGIEAIIENGVARDIATSGLADLIPAHDGVSEIFALDATQCALVKRLLETG